MGYVGIWNTYESQLWDDEIPEDLEIWEIHASTKQTKTCAGDHHGNSETPQTLSQNCSGIERTKWHPPSKQRSELENQHLKNSYEVNLVKIEKPWKITISNG